MALWCLLAFPAAQKPRSGSLAAISGLTAERHYSYWEDLTAAIKGCNVSGGGYPCAWAQWHSTWNTIKADDKIIGVTPVLTTYRLLVYWHSAAAVSYTAQVGQFALRLAHTNADGSSQSVVFRCWNFCNGIRAAAEGFSTLIMLVFPCHLDSWIFYLFHLLTLEGILIN